MCDTIFVLFCASASLTPGKFRVRVTSSDGRCLGRAFFSCWDNTPETLERLRHDPNLQSNFLGLCIQSIQLLPVLYDVATPGMLLWCSILIVMMLNLASSSTRYQQTFETNFVLSQDYPSADRRASCLLYALIAFRQALPWGVLAKYCWGAFKHNCILREVGALYWKTFILSFCPKNSKYRILPPLVLFVFNRSTRNLSQYWQRMLLEISKELQ